MLRMICLDGVSIWLDADRVEVDLAARGLRPADHDNDAEACQCAHNEAWLPVMTYDDGTTVYLHAPAPGLDGPIGYRVAGPRPHRWVIRISEDATGKVAHLSWETAERARVYDLAGERTSGQVEFTSWRAAS